MTESAAPAKRKKSQKRQRNQQIKIPCTDGELAEANALASAAGLSKAAYGRAKYFGRDPGPRSLRHLPIDAALLRRVEALHMKYGSNLNQIAKGGNSGLPVYIPALLSALLEWEEIRDLILEALGKKTPA